MKKEVKKEKCTSCNKGVVTYIEFSDKDSSNTDGTPVILGSCDYCGYCNEIFVDNNEEEIEKVSEVKHKDGRLFIFIHATEDMQNYFLKEAIENDCFAQAVNFMVRQGAVNIFQNKMYFQGKEINCQEKKTLFNGVRPYISISNANPDKIGDYYSWTYLESALETGWKRQFSGHDDF